MGREVRRVPVDFDWPLLQVWPGFVMPADLSGPEQDAWRETAPPSGDGWQLWEDVSEGSPVSPVFPDRESFVDWLSKDYRNVLGSQLSRSEAEALVDAGWCPSFGIIGRVAYPGEVFMAAASGQETHS